MSELIGMVLDKHGERSRVRIDHKISTREYKGSFVDVWNSIAAKPGEMVYLEEREFDPKKAKIMVYGLTPLCVITGIIFGNAMNTFFALAGWYRFAVIILMAAIWGSIGHGYIKVLKRDVLAHGLQLAIVDKWYPKKDEDQDEKDKEGQDKKDQDKKDQDKKDQDKKDQDKKGQEHPKETKELKVQGPSQPKKN